MRSGHIAVFVTSFVTGMTLACAAPVPERQDAVTAATDVPDAPYTRWLYGFDGARLRSEPKGLVADPRERYGTPADGMAYDQEISVQPDTRSVTVAYNETVRFLMPDGQEFRWKFDTPRTVVPLSRIAPADMPVASNVAVFVAGDSNRG